MDTVESGYMRNQRMSTNTLDTSSTVWFSWQKWSTTGFSVFLVLMSKWCRSSSHVGHSLSLRHTAGHTSCSDLAFECVACHHFLTPFLDSTYTICCCICCCRYWLKGQVWSKPSGPEGPSGVLVVYHYQGWLGMAFWRHVGWSGVCWRFLSSRWVRGGYQGHTACLLLPWVGL